jgi:hypothetical protein
MKRFILCTCLAVVAVALVFSAPALAKKPPNGDTSGNGTPKGSADWGVEIIAFDAGHCPQGDFEGTNRRQVAVQGDFGSGVCDNDNTAGCDSNSDCSGGSCVQQFGVCAYNGTTSCHDDFDCDLGNDAYCNNQQTCTAGVCSVSGSFCSDDTDCLYCQGGTTTQCAYDQDCLDIANGEFCTAGPLPIAKTIGQIDKTNKIFINPSPDDKFHVVDGNACGGDSDGAELQFPTETGACDTDANECSAGFDTGAYCESNDDCRDGVAYAVFARLVGKLGTSLAATLCGFDEEDLAVCSSNHLILARTHGKNDTYFVDATTELLTVCLDQPCTKQNSVALFDPLLTDFFWTWNTNGKPHAQLRFYHL